METNAAFDEQLKGFLRHALTFGGGLLVTKGYVDASEVEALVGAIITLSGFAWSYWIKRSNS